MYVAPLFALDLSMVKKFADVPLADILASGNYDAHRLLESTQTRTPAQ